VQAVPGTGVEVVVVVDARDVGGAAVGLGCDFEESRVIWAIDLVIPLASEDGTAPSTTRIRDGVGASSSPVASIVALDLLAH
jgi:hypothetical protein